MATVLRPGNATANNAEEHVRVFETAVAQLLEAFFAQNGALGGEKILLIRADSAEASRKFLWHLHHAGAQFSVSYPVPPGCGWRTRLPAQFR